jgi:hypothetical protein
VEFDHVGLPGMGRRDGMRFLGSKRLWLTSPVDHPYRVEWLGYEVRAPRSSSCARFPTSPTGSSRSREAMGSHPVLAEPFDVFGEVRVSFIEVDGAPVEFVQPY